MYAGGEAEGFGKPAHPCAEPGHAKRKTCEAKLKPCVRLKPRERKLAATTARAGRRVRILAPIGSRFACWFPLHFPSKARCGFYGFRLRSPFRGSRPGKPCIPPPPFWPYKGLTGISQHQTWHGHARPHRVED